MTFEALYGRETRRNAELKSDPAQADIRLSCVRGNVVAVPIAGERYRHAAADPTADARPFLPAELPAGCRQRSGPCRRAPGDGSGNHADHRTHSRPQWTPCSRSAGRDLAVRRE